VKLRRQLDQPWLLVWFGNFSACLLAHGQFAVVDPSFLPKGPAGKCCCLEPEAVPQRGSGQLSPLGRACAACWGLCTLDLVSLRARHLRLGQHSGLSCALWSPCWV